MSDAVNVLSVDALHELRMSLLRFAQDSNASRDAVRWTLQSTYAWLDERLQHWHQQVRTSEVEFARAQAALSSCEASGSYDSKTGHYYRPNCSSQQAAVHTAGTRLAEMQRELSNTINWASKVRDAGARYEARAQNLAIVIESEIPKAASMLAGGLASLAAYSVAEMPHTVPAPGSLHSSSIASVPVGVSTAITGAVGGVLAGLVGGAMTQTLGPASAHIPAASVVAPTAPSSIPIRSETPVTTVDGSSVPAVAGPPMEATKVHANAENHAEPPPMSPWTSYAPPGCPHADIVRVPFELVDMSDLTVHEEADYRKVSMSQMVQGLSTLRDIVLPAVALGHGGDYFDQIDEANKTTPECGVRRVFDAFFGSETIHLEQNGGTYSIINGQHRLYLMRQFGWTQIPARITRV